MERQTTTGMRARADETEHVVHLRLLNWAWWVRGGLMLGWMRGRAEPPDELPWTEAIESDARLVEEAMCELKQFRPKQWKALKGTYLVRYGDASNADYCKCPVSEMKSRRSAAYRWLVRRLPEMGWVVCAFSRRWSDR
jgi:hypothetical protein